jgi:hypothetical protein
MFGTSFFGLLTSESTLATESICTTVGFGERDVTQWTHCDHSVAIDVVSIVLSSLHCFCLGQKCCSATQRVEICHVKRFLLPLVRQLLSGQFKIAKEASIQNNMTPLCCT